MSLIKPPTSRASRWPWMATLLAFPLLFWLFSAMQEHLVMWSLQNSRFLLLQFTHPQLAAPLAYVISLVLTLIPLVGFAFYGRLVSQRSWSSLGFVRPVLRPWLLGFVLGTAHLLSALVLPFLTDQVLFRTIITPPLVPWLYLAGFLIQGLSEEVICRGFLMNGLAQRFPLWLAALANSLIFAALHLGNPNVTPLSLVNLVLAGLTFSLLFAYCQNIWLVGAAHSAWNFVQGPVLGIRVSGMSLPYPIWGTRFRGDALWTGGDFGLEGGLYCLIVEVLAILILIVLLRRKAQQTAPEATA